MERYQKKHAGNTPDQLKKSRKPKSACVHQVNVQSLHPHLVFADMQGLAG